MNTFKIIPHSTLKNDNIKNIVKGLHKPVKYIERYNIKGIDKLLEEGERVPLSSFTINNIKRGLERKSDSDLMVLQNNLIYEITIKNNDIDFNVISEDIESVKKVYSKYITDIKTNDIEAIKPVIIDDRLSVIEMINQEHFLFSLNTTSRGIEPLKYVMDLKRQLKEGEEIRYQVICKPISCDWWVNYGEAYKKFKEGSMPRKVRVRASDILKVGGDLTLKIMLEFISILEEVIYGDVEVAKIDLTEDSVTDVKRDKGLSTATLNKGTELGYEVGIRGLIYANTSHRREFLSNQFKICFSCLDGDNRLIRKDIKLNEYNKNRVKYRELINSNITANKCILSISELSNLFYLPQITLQQEYNINRLDFREVGLKEELREGIIPIGTMYGNRDITAYWSKVKDVLTLSKVIVGVKGSGKSKYLENYVYYAYKSNNCIIYFDYIENNQNAREVSKHVPKEDIITLDLSKGFTFEYPELDLSNIVRDEDYKRTIKKIASEYCTLVETFVNTINTDDTAELSGNMRNILVSACSFTFLVGDTALYNVYKILSNHKYRETVIKKVKDMDIYRSDDFRYSTLSSLNVVEANKNGKGEKVVGTNNKADRVLDRFNALLRDSRTEEMLIGIDRNNINFVEVFEQNKLVLILMPEDYFSNDELKDIVVTYFLSRMWLSALKRGALIPDREKRNVIHIVLDEIHKLKHSTNLMIKNIAEDRKFRTTYIYTCQYLKQFGNLWGAVKGSGSHYMLLSGTEKENFTMLREEIGDNFTLEELINLPKRTSLNIVRYNGQNISTFITSLPMVLERRLGTTINNTPKVVQANRGANKGIIEGNIIKSK